MAVQRTHIHTGQKWWKNVSENLVYTQRNCFSYASYINMCVCFFFCSPSVHGIYQNRWLCAVCGNVIVSVQLFFISLQLVARSHSARRSVSCNSFDDLVAQALMEITTIFWHAILLPVGKCMTVEVELLSCILLCCACRRYYTVSAAVEVTAAAAAASAMVALSHGKPNGVLVHSYLGT